MTERPRPTGGVRGTKHLAMNSPEPEPTEPEPTFDVMVTCGDKSDALLWRMISALRALHTTPTIHTGSGVWEGEREASATLAWFGVSALEADVLRRAAIATGRRYGQDAIGFIQIPAGSALIDTRS